MENNHAELATGELSPYTPRTKLDENILAIPDLALLLSSGEPNTISPPLDIRTPLFDVHKLEPV
eukprot:430153-Pleurochrysis_carterae.AAC.1